MSEIGQIIEHLRAAERLARDLKHNEPLYASADTLHRRINEAKRIAGQVKKRSSVPRAKR